MTLTGLAGAPPGPSRQARGRDAPGVASLESAGEWRPEAPGVASLESAGEWRPDGLHDRLPPTRGRRDLFPLPLVVAGAGEQDSQSWRSRCGRRRRWVADRVSEMAAALNWMHGFKGEDSEHIAAFPLELSHGVVDPVRLGVLARLEAAARRGLGVAPHDPQTALRLILRGRSPYDERASAVTLAPFRLELLSLPGDVHG